MEIKINGVNIFNPLEGKLDEIIECFVEFYGEKHREKITNNIKNAEYFFLPRNNLEGVRKDIDMYFDYEIKRQLHDKFYKTISSNAVGRVAYPIDMKRLREIQKEIEESYLREDYEPTTRKMIMTFLDGEPLVGGSRLGIDVNVILQHMGEEEKPETEIHKWFRNPENKKRFDSFVNLCEEKYIELGYDKIIEDLRQNQQEVNAQIQEIDSKIEKARGEVDRELWDARTERIKTILGDRAGDYSDREIKSLSWRYQDFLGASFENEKFINRFAKRDFVEFCQKLGYNLGENFYDYYTNPEIQENILNKEFLEEYKGLRTKGTQTIANANLFYTNCVEKLEKLDIAKEEEPLVKHAFISYMSSMQYCSAFTTSTVTNSGGLQFMVGCPFAVQSYESSLDLDLIHEMGHVVSASSFFAEGELWAKYGFDIRNIRRGRNSGIKSEGMNGEEYLEAYFDRDKFAALNEVVNDYFTQEIYAKVREKGIILNLGEQQKESKSSYAPAFSLVGKFIESHKEEIKDAFISANPMALVETFGKENAEMLADACSDYLKLDSRLNKKIEFSNALDELRKELAADAATDEEAEKYRNLSTYDAAILPHAWPLSVLRYVDCFKKVAQVERNIQLAKSQNAKIDKTKDAEITL